MPWTAWRPIATCADQFKIFKLVKFFKHVKFVCQPRDVPEPGRTKLHPKGHHTNDSPGEHHQRRRTSASLKSGPSRNQHQLPRPRRPSDASCHSCRICLSTACRQAKTCHEQPRRQPRAQPRTRSGQTTRANHQPPWLHLRLAPGKSPGPHLPCSAPRRRRRCSAGGSNAVGRRGRVSPGGRGTRWRAQGARAAAAAGESRTSGARHGRVTAECTEATQRGAPRPRSCLAAHPRPRI